jgi:putative SOS response-associated peptidase YedK
VCFFVEINLPRQELEKRFGVPMPEDPRYMPSVFMSAFARPWLPVVSSENPAQIMLYRWGLIPSWIRDTGSAEKISLSTANARSETAWEKPSFRASIKGKRCLVLVNSFFEWHSEGKTKTPFRIRLKDQRPFTLAGIWESWKEPGTAEVLKTFSILTTEANPMMAHIHNTKKRMPAIIPASMESEWIKQDSSVTALKDLLTPFPENLMEAYPLKNKLIPSDSGSVDTRLLEPREITDSPTLW